jgi:imidazolonepropionase-like amidohydrolase
LPTDPAVLPEAAAGQAAAGARWVKIVADWFSPETGRVESHYDEASVSAAVQAAHAAGARVAMHCMDGRSLDIALATGIDSIEHACNATRAHVERMAAQNVAWCPTITLVRGFMTRELPDPDYQTRVRAFYNEGLYELLPLAASLGVTILAGSDTLAPAEFWREIAVLHEYGLEPSRALAAATTDARRYFGAPDLEEGAPADVVLYDADPRDDPAVLASPSLVMVDGKIASRRR